MVARGQAEVLRVVPRERLRSTDQIVVRSVGCRVARATRRTVIPQPVAVVVLPVAALRRAREDVGGAVVAVIRRGHITGRPRTALHDGPTTVSAAVAIRVGPEGGRGRTLIHLRVAVVVDAVAGLRRARIDGAVEVIAIVAHRGAWLAGHAPRYGRDSGIAEAIPVCIGPRLQHRSILVHLAIAVVVAQVAAIGQVGVHRRPRVVAVAVVGHHARLVAAEARRERGSVAKAVAICVGPEPRRRKAIVDRAVAVVVAQVAVFGRAGVDGRVDVVAVGARAGGSNAIAVAVAVHTAAAAPRRRNTLPNRLASRNRATLPCDAVVHRRAGAQAAQAVRELHAIVGDPAAVSIGRTFRTDPAAHRDADIAAEVAVVEVAIVAGLTQVYDQVAAARRGAVGAAGVGPAVRICRAVVAGLRPLDDAVAAARKRRVGHRSVGLLGRRVGHGGVFDAGIGGVCHRRVGRRGIRNGGVGSVGSVGCTGICCSRVTRAAVGGLLRAEVLSRIALGVRITDHLAAGAGREEQPAAEQHREAHIEPVKQPGHAHRNDSIVAASSQRGANPVAATKGSADTTIGYFT